MSVITNIGPRMEQIATTEPEILFSNKLEPATKSAGSSGAARPGTRQRGDI